MMDNKIKAILSDVVAISTSEIDESTHDWDSMEHLEIVNRIEEEFKIDIDTGDMSAMKNFNEIKKIVRKYLKKKDGTL